MLFGRGGRYQPWMLLLLAPFTVAGVARLDGRRFWPWWIGTAAPSAAAYFLLPTDWHTAAGVAFVVVALLAMFGLNLTEHLPCRRGKTAPRHPDPGLAQDMADSRRHWFRRPWA